MNAVKKNNKETEKLLRHLPPLLRMAGGLGKPARWFGMSVSVFCLAAVDHNVWIYLTGPWLSAYLVAIYYHYFPPNWYRGDFAATSGYLNADRADVLASRFVDIFSSPEMHRYLWRQATRVAAIEFGFMLLITAVSAKFGVLKFDHPSLGMVTGILGGAAGALAAIGSTVVPWVINRWSTEQLAEPASKA